MKLNKWTLGLAAAGVVSLASTVNADEAKSQVLTALSSTTLSGFVDTSAIWKFGTGDANMPGRAYDGVGKLDGFNLNLVKLSLDKPLEEGQWSSGYHVDLLFGPDAVGYNTSVNAGVNSDFGIKQAYVTLRAPVGNGLDLKMGVFDTIIGYEVYESVGNPNYSRSFGWQLEPTQHTGLLGSYQVADWVSVSGGLANTYDAGINRRRGAETRKTFLGSITLTAPDSMGALAKSALYAGIVSGLGGNAVTANGSPDNTTSIYAGATINTPIKELTAGVAWDYRWNAPNMAGNSRNRAYAAAVYASFQASEKLKLNTRLDYLNGDNGTMYVNARGSHNQLLGVTETIDYSLWANVVSRLEARWDHSLSGDRVYGGTVAGLPSNRNAITLAANIVYKF